MLPFLLRKRLFAPIVSLCLSGNNSFLLLPAISNENYWYFCVFLVPWCLGGENPKIGFYHRGTEHAENSFTTKTRRHKKESFLFSKDRMCERLYLWGTDIPRLRGIGQQTESSNRVVASKRIGERPGHDGDLVGTRKGITMRRDKPIHVPELKTLTCPKCGANSLEQMNFNDDYIICRSCLVLYCYDETIFNHQHCFRLKSTTNNNAFILKEGNHW
jgi:hypothetical protein